MSILSYHQAKALQNFANDLYGKDQLFPQAALRAN